MPRKPRDLEERTAEFAAAVRVSVRGLPRTVANFEDIRQLIRASGSVPANCIEADDALGNKDRVMKFRISRKEAKECQLWLRVVFVGGDTAAEAERARWRQEAHELELILTSIIKQLE